MTALLDMSTENALYAGRFFEKYGPKVRDHDHLIGVYRGPAHQSCNLNLKLPKFIPIIVHNLSRYDAHLVIKALSYDNNEIKLIANTKENYISFSKNWNTLILIQVVEQKQYLNSEKISTN